jgi:hypothetical protein
MRFIIFSLARCGSTTLMHALNCYQGVRCVLEPFTPANFSTDYGNINNAEALDSALGEIWREYNGIKHVWHPSGWPFGDTPDLNHRLLQTSGAKIIFLRRRNDLRRVVSSEISWQTGVWGTFTQNDRERVGLFDYQPLSMARIQHQLKSVAAGTSEMLRVLSDARMDFAELFYEDLFGDDNRLADKLLLIDRLRSFIGAGEGPDRQADFTIADLLNPVKTKLSAADLYRRIPNIEEIERRFGSSETGWLLRDTPRDADREKLREAGYQARHQHILDYGMYELPGVAPYEGGGRFRGPRIRSRDYIACIGGAQTFGCFCRLPYPVLLTRDLGVETLNLGYGGAGPTFHNSNARLLEYINGARLVIVQVMSARSQSNSLFETRTHVRSGIRVSDGAWMSAEAFYHELTLTAPELLPNIVTETRANYVRDTIRLLNDIRPPKILLWFSRRHPKYKEEYKLPIWNVFGGFPQLVNEEMIIQIKVAANDYVECITSRGMPQSLFDRAGSPTTAIRQDAAGRDGVRDTHNNYYPSPEMHADAAAALAAPCRKFLK